ncbi:RNA polymerase sigma factor [Streptomyces virginiae]|uniref:RNA polymerase sigma factor n=1 Tax=Streptomyces virginiae TaxID=1961 RepID=UPI0035E16BE1
MSADEHLLIDGKYQERDSVELRDFDTFYAEQLPHVLRTVRTFFGPNIVDGIDTEDIVQNAFVAVLQNWERVGRLASPRAYLHTVANNLVRKTFHRRSVPLTDAHLDTVLGHEPSPESHLEAHLDRLRVLQAVGRLAPRQAQVVGLQLDGLADTDIAAALNITTDAVRSHRRHAKIALRHPIAAARD